MVSCCSRLNVTETNWSPRRSYTMSLPLSGKLQNALPAPCQEHPLFLPCSFVHVETDKNPTMSVCENLRNFRGYSCVTHCIVDRILWLRRWLVLLCYIVIYLHFMVKMWGMGDLLHLFTFLLGLHSHISFLLLLSQVSELQVDLSLFRLTAFSFITHIIWQTTLTYNPIMMLCLSICSE